MIVALRFLALMLTSLVLGLAFCHVRRVGQGLDTTGAGFTKVTTAAVPKGFELWNRSADGFTLSLPRGWHEGNRNDPALAASLGKLPPSSERLATLWRPYVETCITAFGPSRAMFESNFPVDKGSYGYGMFWNACKRLAQGASAAEKADLFRGTASRFYRLGI